MDVTRDSNMEKLALNWNHDPVFPRFEEKLLQSLSSGRGKFTGWRSFDHDEERKFREIPWGGK